MFLKFASQKSAHFFNPKKLKRKDRKRYFKNLNLRNSFDFKVSRTILGFSRKRVRYSIAHKNGNAIVAFSKREVGVDIEEIKTRKNLKDLFLLFSTPEEQEIFFKLCEKKRLYFFYEVFTFKEALIKIEKRDFSIAQARSIVEYDLMPISPIQIKSYHASIFFHHYFPMSFKYQKRRGFKKNLEIYFLITTFENTKYMICCIEKK